MANISLILPFIVETRDKKENITYPLEVAFIACMTELQRRKTGFLRGTAEKVSLVSKMYYPIWAVPVEDSCLLIDGAASLSYKFTFREPVNIGFFVEDLKKNSAVHQEFMDAVHRHARNIREFASVVNVPVKALIADKDLLRFFLEYSKSGSFLSRDSDEKVILIPLEIDGKTAVEIRDAVVNCLRRIHANVKGLQYALGVLKEEVEFHKRTASYEIERLKERFEMEISSLKLEADKRVKKLTLTRDTTITSILKDVEKKVNVLEKRLEKYMRKLQKLEQRKEAAQTRVNASKRRRKTTRKACRTYELEKYDREINDYKKEVRAISDAIEKSKKEGNRNVKEVYEKCRRAIDLEEKKIREMNSAHESKIRKKNEQSDIMISQAASLAESIESLMDEMKRAVSVFREQITIDWKLDDSVSVDIPIYVIKYVKGKDERYSLLWPMTISEDIGVLEGLRKVLTFTSESQLKRLMRPASRKLDETFGLHLFKRMQDDETFRERINRVCSANSLLKWEGFEETLIEGLEEAKKKGWITPEEAVAVCSTFEVKKNDQR